MKSLNGHSHVTSFPDDITCTVFRGTRTGPVVVLTAGIHGTEIAGVLAAQTFKQPDIVKGTLIIIPIVHVRAFRKRIRGKPDLNRTFPRYPGDKAKHRISRKVFAIVKKHRPNLCIDLHEANGFHKLDHRKLGQTLIVYPNLEASRMAEQVVRRVNRTIDNKTKKFTVHQSKLPGSYRTAVGELLGCHAVTVETSMQQSRKRRVQYQTQIIREFLGMIGMMR